MVEAAKKCYKTYPTVVNAINESGISYNNVPEEYARMDNKFARGQRYIGESSNLAQLAMSYYWTEQSKELYDNFVILAVLAQVVIDSCKREFEIDYVQEIERIKSMSCMTKEIETIVDGKKKMVKKDLPKFMYYTRDVKTIQNGNELSQDSYKENKEEIRQRINYSIDCPMNYLIETLDKIQGAHRSKIIDTREFVIHIEGKANSRQMSKIRALVEEYDNYARSRVYWSPKDKLILFDKMDELVETIKKIKIRNPKTINRIIETALGIGHNSGVPYKDAIKHTRCILKTLYRCNKEMFLSNFIPKIAEQ